MTTQIFLDNMWSFDNTYCQLPEFCFTKLYPTAVSNPSIVRLNYKLANELGISMDLDSESELAQLFSGNKLPAGADPIAQTYAGHQFGHFTILGDGRAHLLGEHITADKRRFDIQLKGSGKTPYSRGGDGRAALGPMLREYIISEAMHALGIPTTRSLVVVTTGELVHREIPRQGAILTRVAASHIRVGTFEYMAMQENNESLRRLADYTIERHYPILLESEKPYHDLIEQVMARQIDLIVNWLRVGFIHGVMNTDNMTLSGETIDYGPCAFLDEYDPQTVFSSIDHRGRYAYGNQAHITQWNLARLAEALLPLLHVDNEQATAEATDIIESFTTKFEVSWRAMMRKKLGLLSEQAEDESLISELLSWMQDNRVDYTNTFRDIIGDEIPQSEKFTSKSFQKWWSLWQARLKKNPQPLEASFEVMRAHNPAVIPRNHKVEEALIAAEGNSDFAPFEHILEVLSEPYITKANYEEFRKPPTPQERVYQTFCGT